MSMLLREVLPQPTHGYGLKLAQLICMVIAACVVSGFYRAVAPELVAAGAQRKHG
jgi:hypothetical protein